MESSYIKITLAVIGVTFWSAVWCIHLIAIAYAQFHLYSWRRRQLIYEEEMSNKTDAVGVSIIKTITTVSPCVLVNLESVFQIQYPKFEVLICVQDDDSDAIPYIKDLISKYTQVDAHLFAGALNIGINPKINNIMQCYDVIKYQYVWICDSNILVNENSLRELAVHLKPNVGMVHQLPYISSNVKGFAGCLEKVHFGTHHARWYFALNALNICCTNGMSSIFDKKLLDEVGGLSAFSCYIAEDFFMGKSYYDRGFKILLSTEPAIQNPDVSTIEQYIHRITRWQKLRMTMSFFASLQPLIECFMIGVIGSSSIAYLFNYSVINVYLLHVCVWFLFDKILMYIIEKKCSKLPPLLPYVIMWLFREIVTFWIFVETLFSKTIQWRMGTFELKFGGKADFVANEKQT